MEKLQNKIWYRALKVIFVIVFILTLVIVAGGIYTISTEQQSLVINCDNGKKIIKNEQDGYTDIGKYRIYRECSEVDYRLSQSKKKGGTLSEEKRKELDVVVEKMVTGGSSDKEIQEHVDNYKEANGVESNEVNRLTRNQFQELRDRGLSVEQIVAFEKSKTYTLKEFFGDTDISNGFIKNSDDVLILANYKILYEQKYSSFNIASFILAGVIVTILIFWVITRIFFYVFFGEKFFKLIQRHNSDI
ncbi:TPA: hypothetical protein DEW47_03560 [Patescibacteria group bacterium]|nr:MAG: hypothetical protein UT71_C0001G0050 [Parcubacteria group bacterium GW2011_GWF2_40_10]KKR46851.1 MAG: hypothetical protein UT83_C0017G0003 [Parcubacteria group bacterium GW2011_GWA2_40_143]KKR60314.1 MAG: hypothetical protein UT97_C0002G0014 [Parcubacteria group bacterium GW2011_GWC2_40_31]KKR75334.1 MAG: hypothetical protein UU18_C0008G0024 [Parcubacteria group bacterium GW2011_GWB2_40_8]KKR76217.1 MAG: hypothetical protein UU20_C0030G0004 [Parcubacteria group bacterium GW2011_GWE2_40_